MGTQEISTSKTLLKTEKLAVGYQSPSEVKTIISQVDLNLNEGELIGLVGINGSGKSTLLRSLAGLQKPLQGRLYLHDTLFGNIPAEKRAQLLSVVLTGQYISKNLSVLELIALGRQPYTNWLGKLSKKDKEKIDFAIQATALEDLVYNKCHSLSDGQLQRALVARAVAQDTSLIILDEPTTHLDLHHKASVLNLLQEICKKTGRTILFSTHDIELIIPLCDKMIVLKDQKSIIEKPKILIEREVFSSLFPSKIIGFDRNTERFYLKK